ncbi:hypothetical protein DBV05_g6609 [Lasiodiplodia theobromae]|uniref:Uncharacterized protein n=1 Tax=Lasiodiplodia theobromae TaxID=45133 RepID=A0A5N5DA47_9PEZI|nr:hypothetical protein DBV05_g6609 [Lasiodiplodia theobromae]
MSFSVRLELMLTEKLHIEATTNFSKCFEADTYNLKWKHGSTDDPPDISDLPSVDHALYLFHTVKFHLGHHYRSFNDREFIDHVHQFYYGNALEKATESRLWFVQFLLVLAFVSSFSTDSQEDSTLGLQVKLSHLLSVIVTTIYKAGKTQLGVFLETIRSTLRTMAGHAQEIEDIVSTKFRNSVKTMPRVTRHITLLYHQCVIVATRPLLLSVLKERLENMDLAEEDWQSFLALTTNLISTGINSAVKTLQILSDNDSILETFLPFDLEFTYGAALHLIMANAIFPGTAGNESYEQQALDILDEMIGRGNRVAAMRKAELVRLQELCQELAVQSERRGLQALTLASLSGPEMGYGSNPSHEVEQPAVSASEPVHFAMSMAEHATESFPSDCAQTAGHAELFDNLGISSCEFLSIADQLGDHDILSYGLMDTLPN